MRLPTELKHVHVFHILQLRRYLSDPHHGITSHDYDF